MLPLQHERQSTEARRSGAGCPGELFLFPRERSADGRDRTGAGFPGAAEAAITCRLRTGFEVYAQNCASCHGAQGLGQSSGGQVVFPPLWGPRSTTGAPE